MVGDGAVVSASSTKDHYAFGESNAARKAFAGRTIDADLAFLVPFLKPGLSLVDCGCGGGGLAVQLSERLTPGEVVGFDQNGGAIEQAKQLAASVADAGVRFFVASVYDAPLPQGRGHWPTFRPGATARSLSASARISIALAFAPWGQHGPCAWG